MKFDKYKFYFTISAKWRQLYGHLSNIILEYSKYIFLKIMC